MVSRTPFKCTIGAYAFNEKTYLLGPDHITLIVITLFLGLVFSQMIPPTEETPIKTRQDAIPDSAVKILPEDDIYPPLLHLELWQDPIPLLGPINTAGAEDSAFITPDGNTMYFFFTPDPSVEPED